MRTFYNPKKNSTKIEFDIWPIFLKNHNGGGITKWQNWQREFSIFISNNEMYTQADKKNRRKNLI